MDSKPQAISIAEGRALFELDNASRSLTPRTQTAYRIALGYFVAWSAQEGLVTLADVTPGHVRRYQLFLQERTTRRGRSVSAAYVHHCMRALRRFFRFAKAEGLVETDAFRNVRLLRVPEKVLQSLTDAEVALVLGACNQRRDKALVALLVDTGLRSAEACALNIGDVDMATGAILVRKGKGQKGRMVYAGATARKALRHYLAARGESAAEAPLLARLRGGERLTTNAVTLIFHRLRAETGVAHLSAHALRRTFALSCLRNGMDLHSLRLLMGHSDLDVLKQYLDLGTQDLRGAHERFGPLDGKSPGQTHQ